MPQEDRIRLLAGGVTSLREDLVRVSFDIGQIALTQLFTARGMFMELGVN